MEEGGRPSTDAAQMCLETSTLTPLEEGMHECPITLTCNCRTVVEEGGRPSADPAVALTELQRVAKYRLVELLHGQLPKKLSLAAREVRARGAGGRAAVLRRKSVWSAGARGWGAG